MDLAQILAEFDTLPAFVSPIIDHYAEGEMPPRNTLHRRYLHIWLQCRLGQKMILVRPEI